MKNVNAILIAVFVGMALAMPTLTAVGMGIEGENYETEIASGWAINAPTIDGDITTDEYTNATMVDIDFYSEYLNRNDTISIYFMNDNEWIYIAVDVLADNTSSSLDTINITFDEDNNDVWEPDMPDFEAWYGITMLNYSGELISQAASLKPCMFMAGFDTTLNDEEVEHRVWEFMIPISMFIYGEVETGDTVGVSISGNYSALAPVWDFPINITQEDPLDAELWAKLTLATEPLGVEENDMAGTYGMIFIGLGAVILLVLVLFHNETFVKWIGDGNYKLMFVTFGLVIALLFLGLLQWYYDWLGYLGI